MYCPECRRVFPQGIFRCQGCDVDLVGTRPGGTHELLPVFETANVFELGLVRSLLLSSGIPVEIRGEEILHLADGMITATVLVPADRAAEAAALLDEHVPRDGDADEAPLD
ncbi:MAG TPA: DUF2007 domain-containing protein [Thermoanaerobaculia bacterium]|nr:DUF2007 domain-containing protein [Thermoanaerobaculia bacterium]